MRNRRERLKIDFFHLASEIERLDEEANKLNQRFKFKMVANIKSDPKYQTDLNGLPKDVPKLESSEFAQKKQLNQVVDGIREVKSELKAIKKFIGKEELKRSPEGATPNNSKGSSPDNNEGPSPN